MATKPADAVNLQKVTSSLQEVSFQYNPTKSILKQSLQVKKKYHLLTKKFYSD